jgi:hypothetical protein
MFGRPVSWVLWVVCEIAIAACDLAEVLGSAIGLQLLFGLPLLAGVILTAFDTLLILFLHSRGVRKMEAFIVALIVTIGACLAVEIVLSKPVWGEIATGFVPSLPGAGALYLAIGILGATVMPHNLYLHSALVQSRRITHTPAGIRSGVRFNIIDSLVALNGAFYVNAALLEQVGAEPPDAGHVIGEINPAFLLQPLVQVPRRDVLDNLVHPCRCGVRALDGNELAMDAIDDGSADLEMHVRRAALHRRFQNLVEKFHAGSVTERRAPRQTGKCAPGGYDGADRCKAASNSLSLSASACTCNCVGGFDTVVLAAATPRHEPDVLLASTAVMAALVGTASINAFKPVNCVRNSAETIGAPLAGLVGL